MLCVSSYRAVTVRPRKPRRNQYETDAQFNQRLLEWQASLPPKKGHNNAMTMLYYIHRLLPIYTEEIHQHRLQDLDCLFEQDNNPLHGTRTTENLVQHNWIEVFDHPPQSAGICPIEACWNILKQRVRQRYFDWHTVCEFKTVVLEEWDKITMKQIRARIAELPIRYKAIIASNGFPYKSTLW
jgi:hypothetical protein